jgi:FMN reductase
VTVSPSVLVVSCSLDAASLSHQLALTAETALREVGERVDLVDLHDWDLPICDGGQSLNHALVQPLTDIIADADAILLASPVYNYDLNAAAKNLIEMTGEAWREKPVGFLCAAGGRSSYMSPFGLANSLMFDFRSLIIPRFVYATKHDFEKDGRISAAIQTRVDELVRAAVDLAKALEWVKTRNAALPASRLRDLEP